MVQDGTRLEKIQQTTAWKALTKEQFDSVILAMTPSGGEENRKRSRGIFVDPVQNDAEPATVKRSKGESKQGTR